ncbi:MAG: tetratricopeptide repeat protein [Ignavibacteriales bacterium]|nr:tetratricopeptide repeat protein [Ignavibacteriales bacterium]
MNRKLIITLVCASVLIGCASSKIQKEKESITRSGEIQTKKPKEAMDHFINGNLADMKGDYASAILEYQDALTFDKSPGIYYALAKDYYLLNKLSLALTNSRKSVNLDSTNTDYFNLLADIYNAARINDSAAVAYEKIIQLDSTDARAYFNLAVLCEQSKPLKALGIYKKLFELTGPDWNVLVRIAELYERMGNTEEAVNSVEQLSAIDPSNTDLQKLVVETYLKAKKFDKALEKVNDLLKQFPEDPVFIEQKAQIFVQQNNWIDAATQYSILLKNPNIPLDTKVRIGSIYLAQSFKDSTLLSTTKTLFLALDKDTVNWQIKMFLGEIALKEKDDTLAISYFKQVTELARWNGEAWVRLGGLYFDNKKYSNAVTLMEEAVQNFPDDFAVNLILGLSYSQMNQFKDAKKYLKKAVELNPKDLNALSAYGYTLSQLKQADESIYYLNEAIKIDPKNVELLGTLGLIYNSLKKFHESDSIYSKAISLDSTNALVLNNFAYSLAERREKLPLALEMSKKAIAKDSLNSSYLDTIGWVYFQLDKYETAEKYISKAAEIDKQNATILEHLGDISCKKGNKNEAVVIWQKALQLNADNPELKQKIEKGDL